MTQTPDLTCRIGDLTFQNPVLTASGTFGYGDEAGDLIPLKDLGGIVTKSVTLEPRAGSPPPRTCETPAGMINSIGLANIGVKRLVKEKYPVLKQLGCRVIVNIAGGSIDEYVRILEIAETEEGADAYEINISCPNTEHGGIFFGVDAQMCFNVISTLRDVTDKPIIAKLTPNVTNITEPARAARDAGADAVSLINTMVGMAVNVKTRRPRIRNVMGGLSGPAIRPIAIAKVFEIACSVDIPIIGIGGIGTAEDALEFILAGASLIEIGTANFYDPQAPISIIRGIEEYMREQGVASVEELIGGLQYV
jgi:dihydroorotate dehydrogenase (NAD+) catalytic subunit